MTPYDDTSNEQETGSEINPGKASELHRTFEQAVKKGVAIYMRTNNPSKEAALRAAIYVRTAAVGEAAYHCNLTEQIKACQTYCSVRGYTIQRIYQEEGVSGSSLNHRPGLDALLAAQDIDVVVIVDYTRISRNVTHVATFLNNLEAKHIIVEAVCFGNDTARFALALIELGREIERQKIIDRMKYAKRQRRLKGLD
jgi:site-specific DNA recombinase